MKVCLPLLQCLTLIFKENPSEEDAQIVEKILAMRRVTKKVVNQVMRIFLKLHKF